VTLVDLIIACMWCSCVFVGYRVLSSWLVCICRFSLIISFSAYAHLLTRSLAYNEVIHCNPLSTGFVFIGHCGNFVVMFSL